MTEPLQRLADRLWRWTAHHPEFHPEGFEEVASFAARAGDRLLLVDPLLPEEPAAVLDALDALAREAPPVIFVTITYHVRSAGELARRWDTPVRGHARTARRLPAGTPFEAAGAGDVLPGGAVLQPIGRPRRIEYPVWLPEHRALVFGDALIVTGGALRIWSDDPLDEARLRFYRERFAPTLQPLMDLDPQRILPTHGPPILRNGRKALEEAVRLGPWYRR